MTNYINPLATPQHRLAAKGVDVGLYIITLGIGWFVWSLITWQEGQTPGKKLLKLRTYDQTTCSPAKWGQMAIREFLLPQAASIATGVPILVLASPAGTAVFTSFLSYIGILILTIALFGFYLVDAIWILGGEKRRRVVDLIAKTDILNEANSLAKI